MPPARAVGPEQVSLARRALLAPREPLLALERALAAQRPIPVVATGTTAPFVPIRDDRNTSRSET